MPIRTNQPRSPSLIINDLEDLIKKLTDPRRPGNLAAEGYQFEISDIERQGGFKRVYISRSPAAGFGNYNLYLDLRVGPTGPGGSVVEMATAKPGTFGIPGFGRHVYGEQQIRDTVETFSSFIRSIYSKAAEENVPPQAAVWDVYQGGYAAEDYPGAGAVLGPSASTGKREFLASTVRYALPEGISSQEYVRGVMQGMRTPGGGVAGLEGMGPELSKWKAWVPLTGRQWTQPSVSGTLQEPMGMQVRTPEQTMKSLTTVFEARELANVPLVMGKGGLLRAVQPTMPGMGEGLRKGWTRSSVILPGELEPRNVLTQRLAMADVPDLPGATLASESAFKLGRGSRAADIYAIGESGNLPAEIGIRSVAELESILGGGGFSFRDIAGRRMRPGAGLREIGRFGEDKDAVKILIERLGYEAKLGRPTLYIPRYYDPSTEGGQFSNLPKYIGAEEATTEKIVALLREKYGKFIDVQGYSAIGAEGEEAPAQMYMNVPMERILPLATKTGGVKGFVAPTGQELKMKLAGVKGKVGVDLLTQEAKIPGRTLMSAFGVMEMQTQLSFLDQFLPSGTPQEQERLAAVKAYIQNAYKGEGGQVAIDLEQMADIYTSTSVSPGQTARPYSADLMFSEMFQRILSVRDPKQARTLWQKFGIGLPTTQAMGTNVYSEGQMQEMKRLIEENPGLDKFITFERIKNNEVVGDLVREFQRANNMEDDNAQRILYRMFQNVPGEGKSAVLTTGMSYVGEYPSMSGFVNAKGIMSMIQNYPQAARAMGIFGDIGGGVEAWLGPTEKRTGAVKPSTVGWMDLHSWLGFQKDLMDEIPSVPRENVVITPEIAQVINTAVTNARAEPNTKAQLEKLQTELAAVNLENYGLSSGWNLSDTYLFEPNSLTVVPKLSSIMNVESYKRGAEEGQTVTRIGQQYMRLLEGAAQAAANEDPFGSVATAKNRFYSRIRNEFYPGGKRSKEIFRNITGVNLPGTRGGRYQGMTQLEAGEAYASDDYIKRMLLNQGFIKPNQLASVMNFLNKNPEAYLPILTQRFPDVSAKYMWMPMKLRSSAWLERQGIPVPKGPAARDVFFMSSIANRFFVGDFDADPAMQKLLPITDWDPERNLHTGIWGASPAVQKEFDAAFRMYNESGNAIDQALKGMFGAYAKGVPGAGGGLESLDVARKNIRDYFMAVQTGDTSLVKRLAAVGPAKMMDLLSAAEDVTGFKAGMGVSYNRRTLTEDIMEVILQSQNAWQRDAAYERGAFAYQMYLDRDTMMRGGFTQLETAISTFGIYNPKPNPSGGVDYNISLMMTNQEAQERGIKDRWLPLGGKGSDAGFVLRNMISNIADMPELKQSNAMLAWGFGQTGRAGEVFEALEDPKAYWQNKGRSLTGVSESSYSNRGDVLKSLIEGGAIGFNSPYYLSMAFRAIRRFARQYPQFVNEPSVKIPWTSGQPMSVRDIMGTNEYQLADIMDRLFLTGSEVIGASELDKLSELGGGRMAAEALGIHRSWLQRTGGIMPLGAAAEEMQERIRRQREFLSSWTGGRSPVVHASELGSLAEPEALPSGWSGTPQAYKGEAVYRSVLRYLGYPDIMGDRETRGRFFIKQNVEAYSTVPEIMEGFEIAGRQVPASKAIAAGASFEAAYIPEAGRKGLYHIGQLKDPDSALKFQVGGITVTGIPDFIGYDEATSKFKIIDTKLSAQDPNDPNIGGLSRSRVMSYKYRVQQLAYAYGLEKKAMESTDEDWLQFMSGWGITDREKLLKMKSAAAQGRFSIALQPGNFIDENLTAYNPIEIGYGASERAEIEAISKYISKNTFGSEMVGYVAGSTWSSLQKPGKIPADLAGYARKGLTPDMSMYRILETLSKSLMRASGGGRFDNLEGKRIRVGEGGPEEIIVSPRGQVAIVPTSELAESKAARGEQDVRAGYMGSRMQGGGFVGFAPGGAEPPTTPPPVDVATPPDDEEFRQAVRLLSESSKQMIQSVALFGEKIGELGQGLTVKLDFGPRGEIPYEKLTSQVVQGMAAYTRVAPRVAGFEQAVSETMLGAFQRAGMGEVVQGMAGQPNAAQLMMMAESFGVDPRLYMPELQKRGLVQQARQVSQAWPSVRTAVNVLQKYPGIAGAMQFDPQQRQVFETMMAQMSREGTEAIPSQFETFTQGQAAAQLIWQQRQDPMMKASPIGGASTETINKLMDRFDKLRESTQKLEEAQAKGAKTAELEVDVRKDLLRTQAQEMRARAETQMRAAGPLFTPEGVPISQEARRAMVEAGTIGGAEIQAADTAQRMMGRAGVLEAQAERVALPTTANRLGSMGRRIFGGFGLMFLGSILGRAVSPLQMGYQEAMQEQMLSEQILGQRFGGFIPQGVPEQRLSRARMLYGGTGWEAIQNMQANMLLRQPGLVGAANIAGTGLAGFAAGSWLAQLAGATASLGGAIGLGVGAAAMLGVGISETVGAYDDPQRAAIARAARHLQTGRESISPFDPFVRSQVWESIVGRTGPQSQLGYQLQLENMYRYQQQNQGTPMDNMRLLLQTQGHGRTEQERLLGMYAQMQASMFPNIEPQAFYTTMGMQMQYGVPLTYEQGGSFEALATMVQQGVPVEKLAQAAAGQPFMNWQQRQEAMGQLMGGWASRGGLSSEQVEKLGAGAAIYQALGTMAPEISGYTSEIVRGVTRIEGVEAAMVPGGGPGFGRGAAGEMYSIPSAIPTQMIPTAREERTYNLEAFQERLATELADERSREIFLERQQAQGVFRRYGMRYEGAEAALERVAGFTPEQWREEGFLNQAIEIRANLVNVIGQNLQSMGVATPQLGGLQDATNIQLMQVAQRQQQGLGIGQMFLQGGMSGPRAEMWARAVGAMTPQQAFQFTQMMQGNQVAGAAFMLQNPQVAMNMPAFMTGMGGAQIPARSMFMTDIGAGGQLTGLNWGTTSLAFANEAAALAPPGNLAAGVAASSARTAQLIWGDWQNNPNLSQGLIQAMIGGGTNAGALWQLRNQAQYQRATSGIGLAQWQLTQEYQPQFWALQDQMTGVQRGQQTWQLDFQQRQMEMQNQFWWQNMSLNRQQQLMGRDWTRQDWGFQDLTRGLQWGWKQEDFAAQARFMTGRERRMAERQMGRETMMFGLEGEQIDKQRQRQQELWGLEDRRYQISVSQHQEEVRMQEEQLQRTRRYYDDVWAIQDKQRDLEREYWMKQQELQKQSLDAAASYNKSQIQINEAMLFFSQWVDEQMGKRSLINPDTYVELANAMGITIDELERLFGITIPGGTSPSAGDSKMDKLEEDGTTPKGTSPKETSPTNAGDSKMDKFEEGRQHGGRVYAGETYRILEGGKPEIFKPDITGTVVPMSDPWGVHILEPPKEKGGPQIVHIILNLGNNRLAERFIDLVDQELEI